MRYIRVSVAAVREAADSVAEGLMGMGAGGAEIHDALEAREYLATADIDYVDGSALASAGEGYDPEAEVLVRGYLSAEGGMAGVIGELKARLRDIGAVFSGRAEVIGEEACDDSEWADAWKEHFKPFHVGGFLIKPTWEVLPEKTALRGKLIIEMDPGIAFGSGTHESTRLCLRLIEAHMRDGDDVLDVGTGSGILGIAAMRNGAGSLLAVDVDAAAVGVARRNLASNGCIRRVAVMEGTVYGVRRPPGGYGLIAANIVASVLVRDCREYARLMGDGATCVVSGIIAERAGEVREAFEGAGFAVADGLTEGEWVAYAFRRG